MNRPNPTKRKYDSGSRRLPSLAGMVSVVGGLCRSNAMKKIKISGKKGSGLFVKIDDADHESLSKYTWWVFGSSPERKYVGTEALISGKLKKFYIHRLIMGFPVGMDIDHINGDVLDNRRINLRVCTRSENVQNMRNVRGGSSKYKGVYWSTQERKWRAMIGLNGKGRSLGYYKSERSAAISYNKAAIKLFGEYAKLNAIHSTEGVI